MKFDDWLDKHEKQLGQAMDEVYMSKSLSRDLDKSRKKTVNKFAIKVDGFTEEEAKTIKRANTLRAEWIRFYMRNNKVSKQEAEKAVTIEKMNEIRSVRDGDWVKMSNAQMVKNIPKPKHGVSAFEDRFKELKKKRDIEGLKKLRQVSTNAGHNNIVNMIDKYLKGK